MEVIIVGLLPKITPRDAVFQVANVQKLGSRQVQPGSFDRIRNVKTGLSFRFGMWEIAFLGFYPSKKKQND